MGRLPGALNGVMRRRLHPDWELRDPRFEEIYSDEEEDDEEDGGERRAMLLDPRAQRARMSEDMYLDRHDGKRNRMPRGGRYDVYGDEFGNMDYRNAQGHAHQAAIREKEDALIHSALARIARARAKGKNNVNLSEEEMEALERRRDPQLEPQRPALASPPPTPAKKGKSSNRSNGNSNPPNKARKRSSGLFGGSSSPAKSSSKAKASPSRRGSLSPPNGAIPMASPGYGPLAYYGHPYPEYAAPVPSPKPVSRPGSRQSKRRSTPERSDYASYPPPHYYYPPPRPRPDSAGSNRSLPDDVDWAPPGSRHRSASNVQYPGYHTDYNGAPALPAAQSRRIASGPPDVRYSQSRRMSPVSAALASRPPNKHSSHSDPAMMGRKGSGLSQEIAESSSSSSESSDDEDEGVQVEVLPDASNGYGYSVARAALAAPPPAGGNNGRKRRSGRK